MREGAEKLIEEVIQEEKTEKRSAKKSGAKNENVIYTSFLETDEYILEQIKIADSADTAVSAEDIKFIIYDKKLGTTAEKEMFLYRGKEYYPIVDNLLMQGVVRLPSNVEEYGDNKTLVEEISRFLFTYFEVPTFFEKFLPYLVLFYWVYEKFPFVPYLHFVGLTGTGKTTAQEVFGSICYKPIDASGAITMSPVFRTASTWKGTLLLDEFEPDGEGYREMLAFLKGGVGNKAVLRTEGESKREVVAYMIKSPKVFTSENPINNAGLQSRTIVIKMEKNKKAVPLYRLGNFHLQALSLRNKLLLWRLRNLDKINLQEIEYGVPELRPFDSRVQQVITPTYYLSDEETKKEIVNFAKVQQEETQAERRESLDGQVFQYIIEHYPTVTLKEVATEISSHRAASRPISEEKVSSIVRKVLGFDVQKVGHEKARVINFEHKEERLKELSIYFGIPVEPSAVSAETASGELEQTDNPNFADTSTEGVNEENQVSADIPT